MILRGEKGVSAAPELIRCLDREKVEVTFHPFFILKMEKKKVKDMTKPLISYAAGKDCKSLKSFFEEEKEDI